MKRISPFSTKLWAIDGFITSGIFLVIAVILNIFLEFNGLWKYILTGSIYGISIIVLVCKKILNKFFEDIIPEMNITYELEKSPRRALKGFLLFKSLGYFIVMSLIAIFAPYGYYAFLLVPIILIWLYMRFGDNGMYSGDELVVLRCRKVARKTVIIQRECVQSMEKVQNVFQKRKAISKYKVNIAGDILGKSYGVGYMDENYINNIN